MELRINYLDLGKAHEIEERTLKNAIDFVDVPEWQEDCNDYEEEENEEEEY